MQFVWATNKLAIVDEETSIDYVTHQYEIEDRWRLVISKNENPKADGPNPKWILSREEGSGELTQLFGAFGVRQFYQESKSKNSRMK